MARNDPIQIYRTWRFCFIQHLGNLHTIGGTLWGGLLASTTSHTSTVDKIALLGLVSKTTSLIGAGRTGSTVDGVLLTELYWCTLSNVQRVYSKTHRTSPLSQFRKRKKKKKGTRKRKRKRQYFLCHIDHPSAQGKNSKPPSSNTSLILSRHPSDKAARAHPTEGSNNRIIKGEGGKFSPPSIGHAAGSGSRQTASSSEALPRTWEHPSGINREQISKRKFETKKIKRMNEEKYELYGDNRRIRICLILPCRRLGGCRCCCCRLILCRNRKKVRKRETTFDDNFVWTLSD